ncbi:uncharacterized protein MELLADRAFT_124170 [Melampsora larici-populina 98AG31]|uniref:Secreted protein n=1 Tax=Melampsora larici-populina (strain 98AG31 / pathotype 3-4-7) TaxID=747676 RepID=F4R6S8_MELLP|nr:uncharacterized protein MELLADRAFT_124170 [Melampsora larici-populina 98AG31]EGG12406.1 secreted protein [Melampsora larici-populina 98AG31]
MFHQYQIKVAVLVFTLCFSAHIVSGLTVACDGGLTGAVRWKGGDVTCIKGNQERERHSCRYKSCSLNGNKWVEMDTCRIHGAPRTDPGISKQQCTDYSWMADGTYSCTNAGDRTYDCYNLSPDTVPYITCNDCNPA